MAKPAAGASRAIYESFSNVGSLWPKDPLRPESNFGQSVVTAAERALTLTNEEGKQGAALPPGAMSSQGVKTRVDSKQLQYRDMSKEEEEVAAAGLKALRQIREGVASHRYPVPLSVLRPASNPYYYSKLAEMLDRAKKGENMTLTVRERLRLFFTGKL